MVLATGTFARGEEPHGWDSMQGKNSWLMDESSSEQ